MPKTRCSSRANWREEDEERTGRRRRRRRVDMFEESDKVLVEKEIA